MAQFYKVLKDGSQKAVLFLYGHQEKDGKLSAKNFQVTRDLKAGETLEGYTLTADILFNDHNLVRGECVLTYNKI